MADIQPIELDIRIVVGETDMPLRRFLGLGRGAVIPLGRRVDAPLAVCANGVKVAEARVRLDGARVSAELLPAAGPVRR